MLLVAKALKTLGMIYLTLLDPRKLDHGFLRQQIDKQRRWIGSPYAIYEYGYEFCIVPKYIWTYLKPQLTIWTFLHYQLHCHNLQWK